MHTKEKELVSKWGALQVGRTEGFEKGASMGETCNEKGDRQKEIVLFWRGNPDGKVLFTYSEKKNTKQMGY